MGGNGLALGAGWRRLATTAAVAWAAWTIVLTTLIAIAEQRVEPFVMVFGLIPVGAWAVTRWKPGRASYTVFGALGLAAILANSPFFVGSLSHPESALGFNVDLVALLAALLQTSVGVAVWAKLDDRLASRAWQVAAGIFVAGLAVSLVAASAVESDQAGAGDVHVDTERLEFAPAVIGVDGTGHAVFVQNRDPFRHTFTVRDTDVDVELPASVARRIDLSGIPAGTYEVICAVPGHEKMTATLTITG